MATKSTDPIGKIITIKAHDGRDPKMKKALRDGYEIIDSAGGIIWKKVYTLKKVS